MKDQDVNQVATMIMNEQYGSGDLASQLVDLHREVSSIKPQISHDVMSIADDLSKLKEKIANISWSGSMGKGALKGSKFNRDISALAGKIDQVLKLVRSDIPSTVGDVQDELRRMQKEYSN